MSAFRRATAGLGGATSALHAFFVHLHAFLCIFKKRSESEFFFAFRKNTDAVAPVPVSEARACACICTCIRVHLDSVPKKVFLGLREISRSAGAGFRNIENRCQWVSGTP